MYVRMLHTISIYKTVSPCGHLASIIANQSQRFHLIVFRESLLTVLRERLLYETVFVLAPDLAPYSDHHLEEEVGVNHALLVCARLIV